MVECANSLKTYSSTKSSWTKSVLSVAAGAPPIVPPFGTLAIAPPLLSGLLLATKSILVTLSALQNYHSPLYPHLFSNGSLISPVVAGLNSSYHRRSGFNEPCIAYLSWPSHFPAPLWQLPGIISPKKYSCPLNNTGLHCMGPLTRMFFVVVFFQ